MITESSCFFETSLKNVRILEGLNLCLHDNIPNIFTWKRQEIYWPRCFVALYTWRYRKKPIKTCFRTYSLVRLLGIFEIWYHKTYFSSIIYVLLYGIGFYFQPKYLPEANKKIKQKLENALWKLVRVLLETYTFPYPVCWHCKSSWQAQLHLTRKITSFFHIVLTNIVLGET